MHRRSQPKSGNYIVANVIELYKTIKLGLGMNYKLHFESILYEVKVGDESINIKGLKIPHFIYAHLGLLETGGKELDDESYGIVNDLPFMQKEELHLPLFLTFASDE